MIIFAASIYLKPEVIRLLFLLNFVFALATLTGYVAGFVNPSIFPWMGFAGLLLPALVAIQIIFALIWLIMGRLKIWLPLVVLFIGYPQLNSFVQWGGKNIDSSQKVNWRVMTYNVQAFHKRDDGNWYETRKELKEFIEHTDIRVMCLQEYVEDPKHPRFKDFKYRHIKGSSGSGLAIFSKYPIISRGEIENPIPFNSYSKFIYADIAGEQDTIRFINVHLVSIALAQKDLSTFVNLNDADQERLKNSGKRITRRLYEAFKLRGKQVNVLSDFIEKSPYPVVLCGDLNDTPGSYTYRQFANLLDDAFVQAGEGFGTTHPKFARYRTPLRIDHIFTDRRFKIGGYTVSKIEFSDHYPVIAEW
jgi:endonuclease/exonuclease/phosphatase family metal-dependent hydrolase